MEALKKRAHKPACDTLRVPIESVDTEVIRLVRAGRTYNEIGQAVGISTAAAWRVAKRAATYIRRVQPQLTTEEREAIRVLHDGGFSVRAIGRVIKRSFVAVRSELRKANRAVLVAPWRCPSCGQRVATERCLLCAVTNADESQAATTQGQAPQLNAPPL